MFNVISRFVRDESGMEMVEWTLVAVLFAIFASAAWSTVGGAINSQLSSVAGTISGS